MRSLLTVIFVFSMITAQAKKYFPATIIMIDGKEQKGYASMPTNKLFGDAVRFKLNDGDKAQKLDEDRVHRIFFELEDGNKFLFEHSGWTYITKNKFERQIEKCKGKKKRWLLATFINKDITSFKMATDYYVDKNNNLISKVTDNSGTWASLLLLVKRPKDKCAAVIGEIPFGATVIGRESRFRKLASAFFQDQPKLVERIKNKEFKSEQIVEVVIAYQELIDSE